MLRKDIADFLKTIPNDVTLVAATKYVDVDVMEEMLSYGINNFGENRVDSFLKKYKALQGHENMYWHFIGHLQRNKAKEIVNKIDFLHSLDSLELADIIDKKRNKPLKTFIEISINLEESKNGVPFYEAEQFINEAKRYKNIEIVGLMMMADLNHEDAENQFKKLRILKDELENKCQIKLPFLSMGMSDDYLMALKEGATHIRLGRILYEN